MRAGPHFVRGIFSALPIVHKKLFCGKILAKRSRAYRASYAPPKSDSSRPCRPSLPLVASLRLVASSVYNQNEKKYLRSFGWLVLIVLAAAGPWCLLLVAGCLEYLVVVVPPQRTKLTW